MNNDIDARWQKFGLKIAEDPVRGRRSLTAVALMLMALSFIAGASFGAAIALVAT